MIIMVLKFLWFLIPILLVTELLLRQKHELKCAYGLLIWGILHIWFTQREIFQKIFDMFNI